MIPEVKKLWLDALRSGKYTKANGFLKIQQADGEFGYCCLGVLCELSPIPGVQLEDGCVQFGATVSYPDADVREWAGLDSANPIVPWHGTDMTLADLNDGTKSTFLDIADLIEEYL